MSRLSLFVVLVIIAGVVGSVLFFQNLLLPLPQIETLTEEQIADLLPETKEQISTPPPLIEAGAEEQITNLIQLEKQVQEIEEQILDLIKKTEEQIPAPLPLIESQTEEIPTSPLQLAAQEVPESLLTQAGVIQWTNTQREPYGLPPLRENAKLNASAQEKMQDMFEEQYFAHISPSGAEAKDLVKNFGYELIALGENLAMGNFQNDQILVQAWMDSPGHQANILSTRYQEIGVAVGKGIFNGQSTWLAVQHFGLPLSACSQPEEALKVRIEENQKQIGELLTTLTTLRAEIRTIGRPRRISMDSQKIEEYNILVSQYNALIEETKDLVSQYNSQVQIFNECAAGI